MLEVVKIVTIVLVSIQILLGVTSWWERLRLDRKYAFPLGSQTSTAQMLEVYSRVFEPINIKVNAAIKSVSSLHAGLLLINRNHVYRSDLYSTCYTLWLIHLIKEQENLRNYYSWQRGGFFVEGLLLFLGFYFVELQFLLVGALVISSMLLISSYFFQYRLNNLKQEFLYTAVDLLNLDQLELSRADHMATRLASHPFGYPIGTLELVVRFFNPF